MNKRGGHGERDWEPLRACTDEQLMSPTHCAKLGLVRRAMQGTELVHHTSGLGDTHMGRAIAPLATSPRSQQILVYGTFLWIQKPRTQAFFGTADEPDMAVEILREFSA